MKLTHSMEALRDTLNLLVSKGHSEQVAALLIIGERIADRLECIDDNITAGNNCLRDIMTTIQFKA